MKTRGARQHPSSTSKLHRRAATTALALAILLVPAAVVTGSAQAQTFKVHSFTGGADGGDPIAALIMDAEGNLYGPSFFGGDLTYCNGYGCGTIFKVDTTGKETVLYSFTGPPGDGALPGAVVLRDAKGNFYGTTYVGGSGGCNIGMTGGCGTVFKLDTTGNETVLYNFAGGSDGANPTSSLIMDAQGNLYGTTSLGGTSGFGTVFKLDSTGKETVLHTFTGYPEDGAEPLAGLVPDAKGNLYGTTVYGGNSGRCNNGGIFGCGTVFKVDENGNETVLYSFTEGTLDGNYPEASLIWEATGNLYGTTEAGGESSYGTVFKVDEKGNETKLFSFDIVDGAFPAGTLVSDAKGNLYGTTAGGGASDTYGVVFKLDKNGEETVLHNFELTYGAYPNAGLVRDAKGKLFGTTYLGGSADHGTVFELTP
jgi:uncharacterized repeat protein (TIGR03803 family)